MVAPSRRSAEFLGSQSDERLAIVNRTLAGWCAGLPAHARADLEGRLRRQDRRDAYASAFWELYLHTALVRSGAQVEVHPAAASASGRPDFGIKGPRGSLYVEAFSLLPEGDALRQDRTLDHVARQMSACWVPGFRCVIHVSELGDSFPARMARAETSAWLAGLPRHPTPTSHEREFQIRDWRFTLAAAWSPTGRMPAPARVPVSGPARTVYDQFRLLERITEKVSKYGSLDAPLVLAVHLPDSLTPAEHVAEVLYGRPQGELLYVSTPPGHRRSAPRPRTAVWDPGSRIGVERLAGVVFADFTLQPWSMRRSAPLLFAAPGVDRAALVQLPWPVLGIGDSPESFHVISRRLLAGRQLGLPEDWSLVE